jgi:NADH:ubiquinone oxidoreductase subunit 3 (subunit A)
LAAGLGSWFVFRRLLTVFDWVACWLFPNYPPLYVKYWFPVQLFPWSYHTQPLWAAQVVPVAFIILYGLLLRPKLWLHALSGLVLSITLCGTEFLYLASTGSFSHKTAAVSYSPTEVLEQLAPLLFVGPGAVLLAYVLARFVGRNRPAQSNASRCRECGYNLTGNVSGRCPECGAAVNEHRPERRVTGRNTRLLNNRIVAVLLILLALGVIVLRQRSFTLGPGGAGRGSHVLCLSPTTYAYAKSHLGWLSLGHLWSTGGCPSDPAPTFWGIGGSWDASESWLKDVCARSETHLWGLLLARELSFRGSLVMKLRQIAMPHSLVAALLLVYPLIVFAIAPLIRRWLPRKHKNVCRECGYNLTGNISGRCPECGYDLRGNTSGVCPECDHAVGDRGRTTSP